jgi:hypothetical protein
MFLSLDDIKLCKTFLKVDIRGKLLFGYELLAQTSVRMCQRLSHCVQ